MRNVKKRKITITFYMSDSSEYKYDYEDILYICFESQNDRKLESKKNCFNEKRIIVFFRNGHLKIFDNNTVKSIECVKTLEKTKKTNDKQIKKFLDNNHQIFAQVSTIMASSPVLNEDEIKELLSNFKN